MKWEELVRTIQYSSAAVSLILNVILIFLIILKSPKQLGTYKYLMIYVSSFEIALSIIDIIVSPSVFVYGSVYMVFVNQRNTIYQKETIRRLLEIWCSFYGFSIGIFVLPFYYRYLVAVGSNILKTLDDWRFILWISFPFLYGISWYFVAYSLLYQTVEVNEYVRTGILLELDMNIDDIVMVGPYFYQKLGDGNYILDFKSLLGIATVWVMVAISLTAIFYFGIKCYKKMRSLMNTTSKLRGLQNQLFYALLTEAIIPLILMHIPVSLLFLFTIYELDVGIMGDMISVTVALFPAIDPLPTMFIIKNYRNTIFSFFCSFKTLKKRFLAMKLTEM